MRIFRLLESDTLVSLFIHQYRKVKYTIHDIEETSELQATKEFSNCQFQKNYIPNCIESDIKAIRPSSFKKHLDFTCTVCYQRFIILKRGGCRECPANMNAYKNQTKCYDHNVPEIHYTITYFLNGFGLLLSVFILLMFVKYRKTPVVKSSHFILSVAQLITSVLLFIIFPVFVLCELTVWTCTIRQTLFCILIAANITITVLKAEKVITICSMKTLMCSKKKRDLMMKQTLITCCIMILEFIIAVSCLKFPSYPITRVAFHINGDPYVFKSCIIGEYGFVQIIYAIILLVLVIVQAYRGRVLPDAYNEGNAIITSSSTTACCYLFLVSYGAMVEETRDFVSVLWICMAVCLIVGNISLYVPKLYIIIFRPSRNTKAYLATYLKTMAKVEKYLDARKARAKGKNMSMNQKRRLLSVMRETTTFSDSEFDSNNM